MKSEVRTLTTREIREQQAGGRRLAPGIWMDREGGIHWSIPELLDVFQLPDTPEHRAAILAVLDRVAREHACEVIVQTPEA